MKTIKKRLVLSRDRSEVLGEWYKNSSEIWRFQKKVGTNLTEDEVKFILEELKEEKQQ